MARVSLIAFIAFLFGVAVGSPSQSERMNWCLDAIDKSAPFITQRLRKERSMSIEDRLRHAAERVGIAWTGPAEAVDALTERIVTLGDAIDRMTDAMALAAGHLDTAAILGWERAVAEAAPLVAQHLAAKRRYHTPDAVRQRVIAKRAARTA